MPLTLKKSRKALTADKLSKLQRFVDSVKSGKIKLLREKTERAKKNLRNSGLI
jgi:hypothetical protein